MSSPEFRTSTRPWWIAGLGTLLLIASNCSDAQPDNASATAADAANNSAEFARTKALSDAQPSTPALLWYGLRHQSAFKDALVARLRDCKPELMADASDHHLRFAAVAAVDAQGHITDIAADYAPHVVACLKRSLDTLSALPAPPIAPLYAQAAIDIQLADAAATPP